LVAVLYVPPIGLAQYDLFIDMVDVQVDPERTPLPHVKVGVPSAVAAYEVVVVFTPLAPAGEPARTNGVASATAIAMPSVAVPTRRANRFVNMGSPWLEISPRQLPCGNLF
jgi:hypothetical protein